MSYYPETRQTTDLLNPSGPITSRMMEDIRSGKCQLTPEEIEANTATETPMEQVLNEIRSEHSIMCGTCGQPIPPKLCGTVEQEVAKIINPQTELPTVDNETNVFSASRYFDSIDGAEETDTIELDTNAISIIRNAMDRIKQAEGMIKGIITYVSMDYPGAWEISECGTKLYKVSD